MAPAKITGGHEVLSFASHPSRVQNRLANACFEGTAWRAPDWGPRRARARNLSREELLSSLQVLSKGWKAYLPPPQAMSAWSV